MKQTLLSLGFCLHGTRAVKYCSSGTIIIDSSGRVIYTYSHGSPLVSSSMLARSPEDIPVILSMFRSRTL